MWANDHQSDAQGTAYPKTVMRHRQDHAKLGEKADFFIAPISRW
jgi:hypothetical protein